MARSLRYSTRRTGKMNFSEGMISSVAPVKAISYRSLALASKKKGFWLPIRSRSVRPKVWVKASTKLTIAPWLLTTPFGTPVEPEV